MLSLYPYSFTFLLVVACAIFYYRAGKFEGTSGLAWAALSVIISMAVWQGLHWGFFAIVLGQLGLFAGLTVYRTWKKG